MTEKFTVRLTLEQMEMLEKLLKEARGKYSSLIHKSEVPYYIDLFTKRHDIIVSIIEKL